MRQDRGRILLAGAPRTLKFKYATRGPIVVGANLDREVKFGLIDGAVLAAAAAALAFDSTPALVILTLAHIGAGLMISSSRVFWLATSVVIWVIAGAVLFGLWAIGWNAAAGLPGGTPDWLTIACQSVLLPGIMLALFSAPGGRSVLADYVKKYGELAP